MSYGVIASKSATVLVEPRTGGVVGTGDHEAALETFRAAWSGRWVPGRVTLTQLKLTFLATSGSGAAGRRGRVEIALADVRQVSITDTRVRKIVGLEVAGHVLHLRVGSPAAFAQQVATAAEKARGAQAVARRGASL